jgi:hypothetical protein
MKLYWQQGYNWQGEFSERKWYASCDGSDCDAGDHVRLRESGSGNTRYLLLLHGDDTAQIQVAGSNLCFEQRSRGSNTLVRRCDASDRKQRYKSGQGDFGGNRFELQPLDYFGCLTNPHHPRNREMIYEEDCEDARGHKTSFWNKD